MTWGPCVAWCPWAASGRLHTAVPWSVPVAVSPAPPCVHAAPSSGGSGLGARDGACDFRLWYDLCALPGNAWLPISQKKKTKKLFN